MKSSATIHRTLALIFWLTTGLITGTASSKAQLSLQTISAETPSPRIAPSPVVWAEGTAGEPGTVGPWTSFPLDDPSWSILGAHWSVDGYFWGVGFDHVFISTDGAQWTSVLESPPLSLLDIHAADSSPSAVAVGTRFLLTLHNGGVVDLGDGTVLAGITELGGLWVAVGGFFHIDLGWQDRIYISADAGDSWNGRTTGDDRYLLAVEGATIQGFPQLVAVGIGGRILTSSDGETWTPRSSGTGFNLTGIAYGNGVWVVVGHSGIILRSTNGATWTNEGVGGGTLSRVAFHDGRFVAVGQGGRILSSGDGANWIEESSGTDQFLEGLAYGDGYWLAGTAGQVLRTSPAFGITPPGDGPGGDEVPATLLPSSLRGSLDYSDNDFADNALGLGTGTASTEMVTFVADKSGISGLGNGTGDDILNLRWTLGTDRVGWQEARVAFTFRTPEDIVAEQAPLIKLYQAPSLDGPWTLVPNQEIDLDAREISGSVTELGHFAMTIASDPACPGATAYLETFESATTIDPGDLGFTVEDLMGAGAIPEFATWLVANDPTLDPVFVDGFESQNPTNYAIQFGDSMTANDDWLISPEFPLENSATYLVQFLYESGTGGSSDLEVYLGTADSAAGLSLSEPIGRLENISGVQGLVQAIFGPPTGAGHHLGLREYSNPAGSSFYSSVDDLVVAELSLPASPAPELVPASGDALEIPSGTPVRDLALGTLQDVDHASEDVDLRATGLPIGLMVDLSGDGNTVRADISASFNLPLGAHTFWVRAVDPCGASVDTPISVLVTPQGVIFGDDFESGDFSAWSSLK